MSNDHAINLPESSENKALVPIAWIDIFYGILISPIQTLNVISKSELYSPGLSALLGAVLMVAICALARASVGAYSSSPTEIALNIAGSLFMHIFFWAVIAIFLRLIAALMKIETSLRTCLIVTAWAFFPLTFKAVAACFSNATVFGDILSWCLSVWFLLLELFAFDSVLKLGRFKTLGVVLILPPCLYFAYFLSMIFAGILITDGLF